MFTTIIFLIVLTILVFVHELGHFLAAKVFKIRVDEFAVGFPPRLWSFMRKGTRFAINLVPLGGYVKIHGENAEDEITPDSILAKPRWQQAVVLIAGVTFNVLFAWLLLSLAFVIGTKASTAGFPADKISDTGIRIAFVAPGSPAEVAGIKPGVEILKVESSSAILATSTLKVPAIQDVISMSSTTVTFTVKDQVTLKDETIILSPKEGIVPGKKAIGISMDEVGTIKLGPIDAVIYGAKSTWVMTENVALGLWGFIKGLVISGHGAKDALKSVSGPVGIAGIVGSSAQQGFSILLAITAVISINLAVLNLVPFPALDGGRLVVVAIEGIIRRRLNPQIINWVNAVGFLLLIGLMLVVTFKDVWMLLK
jgi:regulator of sigma E protease